MQTNARSNVVSNHKNYELDDRVLSPPRQEPAKVLSCPLSWNSILAGVVMAPVVHLVFTFFGVSMGIPGSSSGIMSIGMMIWWILASVASALAAGFTAGHLSGSPKEAVGGWHGLTSWATSILILGISMTTAGSLAGGPYEIMVDVLREHSAPADMPTDIIAAESLLSAIILILGAIAAWFGGCLGAIRPKPATQRMRIREPLH
jgi:hypothetical protein